VFECQSPAPAISAIISLHFEQLDDTQSHFSHFHLQKVRLDQCILANGHDTLSGVNWRVGRRCAERWGEGVGGGGRGGRTIAPLIRLICSMLPFRGSSGKDRPAIEGANRRRNELLQSPATDTVRI
jgi:hypothetical protein